MDVLPPILYVVHDPSLLVYLNICSNLPAQCGLHRETSHLQRSNSRTVSFQKLYMTIALRSPDGPLLLPVYRYVIKLIIFHLRADV